MIRYNVYKKSIEVSFKNRQIIKAGVVHTDFDTEPEEVKGFNTLDDAREFLKGFKSTIYNIAGGYYVEEYYIEENEYSDDDVNYEYPNSGDVWEYSKMQINVVSKNTYDILGSFDSMQGALDFERSLDSNEPTYLSFLFIDEF